MDNVVETDKKALFKKVMFHANLSNCASLSVTQFF